MSLTFTDRVKKLIGKNFLISFQAPSLVNDVIGERQLLAAIISGGLGIALLLGSVTGAGSVSGSSSFNACMGYTSKFEV